MTSEIGAALASVATRVEVGPLGPAAVGQLAREAGQGALAEPILQRTRGHTLFVVEVLRALADGDTGIPESLRSAVQARVRQAGAADGDAAAGSLGARRRDRPADPRRVAPAHSGRRGRALRAGAAGQAAGGQRSGLRVRQRPDPGGHVRHHARADPAGLSPPGGRPADRPAGGPGPARGGRRRLATGGAGLAARGRGCHAAVRGQRRDHAEHSGA